MNPQIKCLYNDMVLAAGPKKVYTKQKAHFSVSFISYNFQHEKAYEIYK